MGKLSTHVLDTMDGIPAQGVRIELYSVAHNERRLLQAATTNSDGRCAAPLLAGADMAVGIYELAFEVGDYFAAKGVIMPEPRFLDQVTIRFGIADPDKSYHVPLIVTPWSYSTYRGS